MSHTGRSVLHGSIVGGLKLCARSMGSVVGVAVSMALLHLLLLAYIGTRMAAIAVLERGAVRVEIAQGTQDQRVQEIYAGLRDVPSVLRVQLLTGTQMLEEEKARDASLAEFLDRYGVENPFSDVFVVVPRTMETYADIRSFIEREDALGGIDPAVRGEIILKESSTREFIDIVKMLETGAGLLVLLAMLTTLVLSISVFGRMAVSRVAIARADHLAGVTDTVIALPVIVAGILAVLVSVAASLMLAAACGAVFLSMLTSSVLAAWISDGMSTEVLPVMPMVIVIELAVLIGLAFATGILRSAFRS